MTNKSNFPVAIFTYRRVSFLEEIFNVINNYKPSKLYIFQNAAYSPDEETIVNNVKSTISSYKFDCTVELTVQPTHLKLNDHYTKSLNSAFLNENALIVLEDDTIPAESFFTFCHEMLLKYEFDQTIGCINGCNLNATSIENSYFYSAICAPFWGWATWKSRWKLYKNNHNYWLDHRDEILKNVSDTNRERFKHLFNNSSKDSRYTTWDILWNWALLKNKYKSIIAASNLVTNKGFNELGHCTNYSGSKFNDLKKNEIKEMKPILGCENEKVLYENKAIELYMEIRANQQPRAYDGFSNEF